MSRTTSTQYAWGTERPGSKLEKLLKRHRGQERDTALIDAHAAIRRVVRMQQDWIDKQQIAYILAATASGAFDRSAVAGLLWSEECTDATLNQMLIDAEEHISVLISTPTPAEAAERERTNGQHSFRSRLFWLTKLLDISDVESDRLIENADISNAQDIFCKLGVELDGDHGYILFHGLNDKIYLPDGTLGTDEFIDGWPNPCCPPRDVREVFTEWYLPALDPDAMREADAWEWIKPIFVKGGTMPAPWKEIALRSYEGNSITALKVFLKKDAKLLSLYNLEKTRQMVWPFFVERREAIRFLVRLYNLGLHDLEKVRQKLADFDYFRSPCREIRAGRDDTATKLLIHCVDSLYTLLPWPKGFRREDLPPPTSVSAENPGGSR